MADPGLEVRLSRSSLLLRTRAVISEWREILVLAIPFTIASSADVALNLVSSSLSGHLAPQGLAAVAAGIAVQSIASQMVAASVTGYQIMAQRRLGAGAVALLGPAFGSALLITVALAFVLLVAGSIAAPALVGLVTPEPDVVSEGATFLRIRLLGLIPWAAMLCLRTTFDANRQPTIGMRAALLMNAANVFLSVPLMFGFGPSPSLGSAGLAIAASSADVVGAAAMLALGARRGLWGAIRSRIAIDLTEIGRIAQLSWPEVANTFADYVGGLVWFALLGSLGVLSLGASRIGFSIVLVVFVLLFNFALSLQILTGRALGAGDGARAGSLFWRGVALQAIIGATIGATVLVAAPLVATIMTSSDAVAREALPAIVLAGLMGPAIGLATAGKAGLRAQGRTRLVLATDLGTVWAVELPVAYVTVVVLHLGIAGGFLGLGLYFVVRAVWSLWIVSPRSFARWVGVR